MNDFFLGWVGGLGSGGIPHSFEEVSNFLQPTIHIGRQRDAPNDLSPYSFIVYEIHYLEQ